jgi:uncharacterized damage-inducible protein DinB
MYKDAVSLFATYNKLSNAAMDGVIGTLNPGEWEKNLGGWFKSVRGLCSHIYLCDFNWLKRFSKFRDFTVLKDELFNREPYAFTELLFPDMGEYLAKRPELDEKILAFAAEVTGEDLEGDLSYTDSSGKGMKRNFGGLILQSLNHDTHHRGMISLYLEMLGKDNDFSSLGQALENA